MKIIQAALFDVDGVLLDTEICQYMAWADTLKRFAGHDLSEQEYREMYCGNSTVLIAHEVKERFSITQSAEEILEFREAAVLDKTRTMDIQQMPYAAEVLEEFAKRIPTALATGAASEESAIKLHSSGLDKIIIRHDIPIISRDMVTQGKPAPETYLLAATVVGVEPTKCIAFEDTVAGIRSADDAGVICLAVPNRWTASQMPKGRTTYSNLREAADAAKRDYSLQPRR